MKENGIAKDKSTQSQCIQMNEHELEHERKTMDFLHDKQIARKLRSLTRAHTHTHTLTQYQLKDYDVILMQYFFSTP